MMTDIFQFSNMYTLRRSIRWLADERHVYEECGPYVTLPGTRALLHFHIHHLSYRLQGVKCQIGQDCYTSILE